VPFYIFQFEQQVTLMTVDTFLLLISLIIAAIGVFFAGFELRQSNRIKRAEFFNQIIGKLRFSEDIATTMLKIEHNRQWYDKEFHWRQSDEEFKIDKLLAYLSYICYLRKTGNIKDDEFKALEYKLVQACKSDDVQSYLWNLRHLSANLKNNRGEKLGIACSFKYLIDFGIEKGIIDQDSFYDEESEEKYGKKLDFKNCFKKRDSMEDSPTNL